MQRLIIDDDGGIICGISAIEAWIKKHPDETDRIIESHKLCLCAGYQDSEAARRVWEALGAEHGDLTELQLLYTKHLQWILERTREHCRSSSTGLRRPEDYWRTIATESMITVPCLWGSVQCGLVRNAAHIAGMPNIDIKLEPLCAAAHDMEQLLKTGDIQFGDNVCFLDIGKGTADIATAMISNPLNEDSK